MIYARVRNRTVAEDYYAAMTKIEKRLDLADGTDDPDELVNVNERTQLLKTVNRLAEPQLGIEARLDLVERIRHVLDCQTPQQAGLP